MANNEPIGVQRTFIPLDLAPDLDQQDLTQSLTAVMDRVYGVTFKRAEQTIRARRATSREAALLNIEEGDPLIVISGLTWDQYGRPVEDLDSIWRYDRYDLRVSHTRD
jgi:GntR family transcriptional regulator